MRLLRFYFGDVAVGVGDLRDGLLVVALRGQGVLHPLGVAAAVGSADFILVLCGTDAVAKPPRLSRETRGLSCGRIDDVEATRHRVDAVAATTSSSSSFPTLSQCLDPVKNFI